MSAPNISPDPQTMPDTTPNTKLDDKEELKKQTEQARIVLMRLQWLVIILLAGGLVWLYFSFLSVVDKVDERLVKIDTVDTRLNDIDDRLFAITPTHDTHKKSEHTDTTNNTKLIKIELAMADRLYKQGNHEDALTALRTIDYQLTQANLLSSSLGAALSASIKADIAHINTLKAQPDAWQAHTIKMRDLQTFLRSKQTKNTQNAPLNRSDILLHDANMMLSLAISASGMRDRGLMTSYLQEVRSQLESHIVLHGGKIDAENLKKQSQEQAGTATTPNEPSPKTTLNTTEDALLWVYDLLANTPKNKELTSVEMLQ